MVVHVKGGLILSILLWCCRGLIPAQGMPYIRTYTVEDGLPSMEIYDVFQDRQGMLWFGTDAGVCRYDGSEFRTFTQRDGLPDHTIFKIFDDQEGNIWFRAYNGLLSWYDGRQIVQPAINAALKEKLRGRHVLSQGFDAHDTLWIGFRGDCSWLKIPPDRKHLLEEAAPVKARFLFREISPGKFASTASIELIKIKNEDVYYQTQDNKLLFCDSKNSGNYDKVSAVRLNPDQVVLAAGCSRYLIHHQQVTTIRDSQSTIFMQRVDDRHLLVASQPYAGMSAFQVAGTRLVREWSWLQGNIISACLQDHEGGVWITTVGSGIKYLPFPEIDQVLAPRLDDGDHLRAMALFPGEGVIAFSTKAKAIAPDDRKAPLTKAIQQHLFSVNSLARIGEYLCVTGGLNTCLYHLKTGAASVMIDSVLLTGKPRPLGAVFVTPYDPSHFCLVTASSLYLLDVRSGRCSLLLRLIPERIHSVAHGRGDTVWLGGISRLWMYVPGKAPQDWSKRHPRLAQHIDALYADTVHGFLWVVSRSSGLYRYGPDGVWDLHTEFPHLPLTCKHVCGYDSTLWMATGKGIWEIRNALTRNPVFRVYNQHNGLPVNNIQQVCMDGDRLWALGDDMLFSFDPERYPCNTHAPRTLLKQVLCNGWPVSGDKVFEVGQNTFRFILSGQSFKSMGALMFRVRMEGADNTWRDVAQTELVYYNLSPGDYVFTAYALNNDGLASETPVTFRFSILPPVWKRGWFIALMAAMAVVVAALAIRNVFHRLRQKDLTRRRLAELEITALRAQMDPHFIFNAINSIYNFVLTGDHEASAMYVAQFARLIRNVLEYAPLKQIPLQKELETLHLYISVEQLRFAEPFTYEIQVDPALDQARTDVVPLLIQPYVENAIWHGLQHREGKGHIRIAFKREGNCLRCVVEDNGVGRLKAAQFAATRSLPKQSLSGALNDRRLQLLKELYGIGFNVRYADHPSSSDPEYPGTHVELCIPMLAHDE